LAYKNKKDFLFRTDRNDEFLEISLEELNKIRSAEELSTKYFDQWSKSELLQFMSLYYQYFNENRDKDNIYDFNEYISSGQYMKDRGETK
jgi:hypothetical protein